MPRHRTKSPVRGLKPVKKRLADGSTKTHWYFRASRGLVKLKHQPDTAAGLLEIRALERRDAAHVETDASLQGVIDAFQASADWRELKPGTQKRYQEVFDYLAPVAAKVLPDAMSRKDVAKLAATAAERRGFRFGQILVANLSALFSWAMAEDLMERNACKGARRPKRPKDLPDANTPWTFQELALIWRSGDEGLRAMILLELFGGVRGQDARAVEWSHYQAVPGDPDDPEDFGHGRITGYATIKNGEPVDIIIPHPFSAFLEALPGYQDGAGVGPIAVSSRGGPYSATGAQRALERARLPHEQAGTVRPARTFHGLRHTLATFARELGSPDRVIADLINDKTLAMAMVYSRGAAKRETGDPIRLALGRQIGHIVDGRMETGMETGPEKEETGTKDTAESA
jgi:integrase